MCTISGISPNLSAQLDHWKKSLQFYPFYLQGVIAHSAPHLFDVGGSGGGGEE